MGYSRPTGGRNDRPPQPELGIPIHPIYLVNGFKPSIHGFQFSTLIPIGEQIYYLFYFENQTILGGLQHG